MQELEDGDEAAATFLLDEDLNWRIAEGLKRLRVKIEPVTPGTKDADVIRSLSKFGHRGVWITADQRARRQFPDMIINHGITVAWINAQNATSLKQGFLVYSFIYAHMRRIQTSDVPLYFHVQEGSYRGNPATLVDVKMDLPRTRGWFD